jgi:hypothetical protein
MELITAEKNPNKELKMKNSYQFNLLPAHGWTGRGVSSTDCKLLV